MACFLGYSRVLKSNKVQKCVGAKPIKPENPNQINGKSIVACGREMFLLGSASKTL